MYGTLNTVLSTNFLLDGYHLRTKFLVKGTVLPSNYYLMLFAVMDVELSKGGGDLPIPPNIYSKCYS